MDLVPEPEGGEEISPSEEMPGSRMKNMGEATGITSEDGTAYKFWLQATAPGELMEELYKRTMIESKKKANFPGFRKVRFGS